MFDEGSVELEGKGLAEAVTALFSQSEQCRPALWSLARQDTQGSLARPDV